MWAVHVLLLFAVCSAVSSFGESGCILQADNSTYCSQLELDFDEPAPVNQSTSVVYISFSKGAISKKTLQPFQAAESLGFYSDDISRVEEGALCSLPHLKDLSITHSNFPILTKGILSGCQKIEKFRTYCSLEEDALYEMNAVENLELTGPVTTDFNKAYLEPLKQLKVLILETSDLQKVDDGLVCSSPVLEDLMWYVRSSLHVSQSLFDGCNNMKKLYITGRDVVLEGNPFANMPHLEELILLQIPLTHLTKDFLTGFQNLKSIEISEAKFEVDGDAFTNVPHLTKLSIVVAELKDSDLEALHPLSELVNLELRSNTIKSLNSLPALPNLERLDVGFNSISKFDFSRLKQKLPKLKELELQVNPLDPELKEELENEDTIKVNINRRSIPL